jgi:hypothetical protein
MTTIEDTIWQLNHAARLRHAHGATVEVTTPTAVVIDGAARKALRVFPGIIGEVLSREILSLREFSWLGEGSRPARLLAAVVELPEPSAEVDPRWTT